MRLKFIFASKFKRFYERVDDIQQCWFGDEM